MSGNGELYWGPYLGDRCRLGMRVSWDAVTESTPSVVVAWECWIRGVPGKKVWADWSIYLGNASYQTTWINSYRQNNLSVPGSGTDVVETLVATWHTTVNVSFDGPTYFWGGLYYSKVAWDSIDEPDDYYEVFNRWDIPTRPPITYPPSQMSAPGLTTVLLDKVDVSFTAPYNGGNAITSYDVQVSTASDFTGATTYNTGSSPYRVYGIAPRTTYYVRVRANNVKGSGTWSSASSFSIQINVPDTMPAPTLTVVPMSSVDVTYSAPASLGLSITSYDIQIALYSDFSGATGYVPTASPYRISSLTPGTLYYVRIRANNALGSGAWSPASSFRILFGCYIMDQATNTYKPAIAYVHDGTSFKLAIPYVYDGSSWKAGNG